MEQSKHTPGPWEYGTAKNGRKRVFAGDREIVRAMSMHGMRRVPWAEREANARLIAASPEMIRALKAALPKLGSDENREVRGLVEAAIAKAEQS